MGMWRGSKTSLSRYCHSHSCLSVSSSSCSSEPTWKIQDKANDIELSLSLSIQYLNNQESISVNMGLYYLYEK